MKVSLHFGIHILAIHHMYECNIISLGLILTFRRLSRHAMYVAFWTAPDESVKWIHFLVTGFGYRHSGDTPNLVDPLSC